MPSSEDHPSDHAPDVASPPRAVAPPAATPLSTPIATPPVEKHRVISLFSGMGGMDVGFAEQVVVHRDSIVEPHYVESVASPPDFVNLRRLPFEIVLQNDILPQAQKLSRQNRWDHNFVLEDLRALLQRQYAFPTADVVTGGFPCQDFSHAGKRRGFVTRDPLPILRRVGRPRPATRLRGRKRPRSVDDAGGAGQADHGRFRRRRLRRPVPAHQV